MKTVLDATSIVGFGEPLFARLLAHLSGTQLESLWHIDEIEISTTLSEILMYPPKQISSIVTLAFLKQHDTYTQSSPLAHTQRLLSIVSPMGWSVFVLAYCVSTLLSVFPLPWTLRTKNIPISSLCVWFTQACLFYSMRAFIWSNNVIVKYEVFCDISGLFLVI